MKHVMPLVVAAACQLAACVPQVAPAVASKVEPVRADECRIGCEQIGMRLTAVVLIMNSAGCVCEAPVPPPARAAPGVPVPPPLPATPGAPTAGASAAAGGAAIVVTAAAAAAQSSQMHSQTQQPPPPIYQPPRH